MYKLPDLSPLTIPTRVVKEGRRIKVIDAELRSGETSVARASCIMLLRGENAPGDIWSPPDWNAPPPESPANQLLNDKPIDLICERRSVRSIDGTRRVWMRDTRELIEGQPLTPFSRVALCADFASPLANMGTAGVNYINADLTLYLHRLPVGEWIGFHTVNHRATDGIAIGECFLYDDKSAIGSASAVSIAQLHPKG